MDPITLTIASIGALASGGGLFSGWKKSKKAKKEQEKLQREQRAANEAWYARNYFGDYLNSTDAQNALRRAKEAREEHSKQVRARQAITGATPEQVTQAEQAGAEVVGDTIANLAAQGSAIKREADRQKLAMDADLNAQKSAMYAQEQAAGENTMSNAASLLGSSLMMGAQGFADGGATAGTDAATASENAASASSSVVEGMATPTAEGVPATGMMDARVNGTIPPWYEYEPMGMMKARVKQ